MKKKTMLLVSIIFVAILTLTGCNAKELMTEVNENMAKITNGRMEMKMNMKFNAQGISVEIPVTAATKFYGDKGYTNMTMTFMGESETMEMYYVYEGNKVKNYAKDPTTEEWYVSEETLDETTAINEKEFLNLVSKLSNMTLIENESTKDVKTYEATLSKETVMELLKSFESEGTEFNIVNDTKVKFSIDMKTKLLTNIYMNFEDAIEMEGMVGGFSFDITFKDLNKVSDFTIPAEVLNAEELQ